MAQGRFDLGRFNLKWLARLSGLLLIALSLVFVGLEVASNWASLREWRPSFRDLIWLFALACLYSANLYLLAENWHRLVGLFGAEPRRRTYRSFTGTQIARYLPGNVAHFLGRAVFLRGGALSDKQLGLATFVEIIVTPAAAFLALLILMSLLPGSLAVPPPFDLAMRLAPAVLAMAGLGGAGFFWWSRRDQDAGARRAITVAQTLGIGTVFMLLLGAIFAGILHLFGQVPVLLAACAAILAWLVGYFTPGAPGGLGTREATLLLLLSDMAAPQAILLATIVFRLVTICGDVLCFGSGWILIRTPPSPTR